MTAVYGTRPTYYIHRYYIRDCCRDNKGFTLIEIIALLVLIAIMSAMAMSRVTATGDSALRVEIDHSKPP